MPPEPQNPPPSLAAFRLWFANKYIEVDSRGECLGPCPEGALGIIVPVWTIVGGKPHKTKALKIPRMFSANSAENELTASVLSLERDRAGQCNNITGLLHVDAMATLSFDRVEQLVNSAYKESRHGPFRCILGLSSGRRPFFVPIDSSSDKEAGALGITLEQKDLNAIQRLLDGKTGTLQQASTGQSELTKSWFVGFPVAMYGWAQGTLQAAAVTGRMRSWTPKQRWEVIEGLARPITGMHAVQHFHGDLRPANVMYIGQGDHPGDYVVVDYGGLDAPTGNGDAASSLQVLTQVRSSVFYAPERASGVEHENADLAIIQRDPLHPRVLHIGIGFRDSFSNTDVQAAVKMSSATAVGAPPVKYKLQRHDTVLVGDRVRLRDYVFSVQDAWRVTGAKGVSFDLLKVDGKVFRVMHERILDSSGQFVAAVGWAPAPADEQVQFSELPLARVVEYPKWGSAADIYSIGVMTLFLFTVAKELQNPREFDEIANQLASPDYFTTVWPELHTFVELVEARIKTATQRPDTLNLAREPVEKDSTDKQSLLDYARSIAVLILHTLPKAETILDACGRNLVEFLRAVHFMLACLHRKDGLAKIQPTPISGKRSWPPPNVDLNAKAVPFAVNRSEKVDANAFLEFIASLKGEWRPYCNGFTLESAEKLAPKQIQLSVPQIRREHAQLVAAHEEATRLVGPVEESNTAVQELARTLGAVIPKGGPHKHLWWTVKGSWLITEVDRQTLENHEASKNSLCEAARKHDSVVTKLINSIQEVRHLGSLAEESGGESQDEHPQNGPHGSRTTPPSDDRGAAGAGGSFRVDLYDGQAGTGATPDRGE